MKIKTLFLIEFANRSLSIKNKNGRNPKRYFPSTQRDECMYGKSGTIGFDEE